MNREEFDKIFDNEDIESKWEGDNAIQGLNIIAKYIDPKKESIVCGADHDVIFSVDIDDLITAGITEEDVMALKLLNWCNYEGEDYLGCFV